MISVMFNSCLELTADTNTLIIYNGIVKEEECMNNAQIMKWCILTN